MDRISRYFPYIVGGTAILIRFFYLWSFWATHPFSQKLISDARIFDDWAQRIASGDWLGAPEVFILPPLYPYLMAVVYTVFGHAPKLIIGLQAAAGCASAILIYQLGARHFGTYAGLFAGLLFASYGPQLFYEGMLLGTSGAVFLSLLGLTLISENNKTHWHLGLAGLVFGLATLMRPNILSAIPFLLFGACVGLSQSSTGKTFNTTGELLFRGTHPPTPPVRPTQRPGRRRLGIDNRARRHQLLHGQSPGCAGLVLRTS